MVDYCQHCEHRVYVKRRGHVRTGGWVWFGVLSGFAFLFLAGFIFASLEVVPGYLIAQLEQTMNTLCGASIFLEVIGLFGFLFRRYTYYCANCTRTLDR